MSMQTKMGIYGSLLLHMLMLTELDIDFWRFIMFHDNHLWCKQHHNCDCYETE